MPRKNIFVLVGVTVVCLILLLFFPSWVFWVFCGTALIVSRLLKPLVADRIGTKRKNPSARRGGDEAMKKGAMLNFLVRIGQKTIFRGIEPDVSVADQELAKAAREQTFEDFEKEHGITQVCLDRPVSRYYKFETEKKVQTRRRRVNQILGRLSKRTHKRR